MLVIENCNSLSDLRQKLIDGEEVRTARQEPCEDAISRQAVLDAIDVKAWEFCDYLISKNRNDEQKPVSHFADNLRECVREELPSVNPQAKTGHWIPVSERLPEESTAVLIWCPERKNIYCAYLEEKQWWIFGAYFQIVPLEVIAWMPLPKPYESQKSNDKCKNCEYYRNPDYTRCHECKAESEDK